MNEGDAPTYRELHCPACGVVTDHAVSSSPGGAGTIEFLKCTVCRDEHRRYRLRP